ncbi:MAG: pyruvate oxidase [Proteobacteria bacterium]|nr:pyruvate oxidase [Pseudomonadota bacterium]
MNISDQIVQILTQVGVKHIFGIPGDTIDSLMESLRLQNEIQFITMRHEATGAFAASAQAKLTGNLAVCVACQGPGAVNLLNGLYDAALDKVPVLAITGQVDSKLIGTHMPQEINQLKLFDDVAIFNQEIRTSESFPQILQLACQAAINQKGVAHIAIPSDIMRMRGVKTYSHNIQQFHSTLIPSDQELDSAAEQLNQAKKITILYGGGCANAKDELNFVANMLKAPLVHTTRSKDILDNRLPNYVGGIGIMGTNSGNYAVSACDALLVVGCSFAYKEFYPSSALIIQIDTDINKMGIHTNLTQGLLGDSKTTLLALAQRLNPKSDEHFLQHAQSLKHKKIGHETYFNLLETRKYVHPQVLTERIGMMASDNAIFCVGTGSVTLYCNNFLELNGKQRLLWSWNLASLGWALGGAIGCKLAFPQRQVIVPIGDGDFQMLIADLITLVKYQLPVTFIVYNNSKYRFIELEEANEGNPAFGTELLNPDYAQLAKAHGALGITVKEHHQIDLALKEAFSSNLPAVIDVHIDPQELYIPPRITPKMALSFAESKIKDWRWLKGMMNFMTDHRDTKH